MIKEEQPKAPEIPPKSSRTQFLSFSIYFLPLTGARRGRQEQPGSLQSKEPEGFLTKG